jgi:hypothetical protein
LDQSKVKMSITQRGNNFDSKEGEKEEEVANMERNKWGMMDLGEGKPTLDDDKHPSKCKCFNFSIFAKFMLALIVLSSIAKKGEIVRKIAPLGHYFVILVIE